MRAVFPFCETIMSQKKETGENDTPSPLKGMGEERQEDDGSDTSPRICVIKRKRDEGRKRGMELFPPPEAKTRNESWGTFSSSLKLENDLDPDPRETERTSVVSPPTHTTRRKVPIDHVLIGYEPLTAVPRGFPLFKRCEYVSNRDPPQLRRTPIRKSGLMEIGLF